jgi:DNA-binding LytR/AlgR family response regulator
MKPLKIGIVEDDLLIAESIAVTLQQIGYCNTQPVRNYADAVNMIKNESPDLLLVDIMLEGDLDGIDLAATINKDFGIPFIFLTANSDQATVSRAKAVNPSAYLVKPFNENDLYSSIEIAFSNYNNLNKEIHHSSNTHSPVKDFVFIKDGETFHKIEVNNILYIESDNIYLTVVTGAKRFILRTKLDDFIAKFNAGSFVRIHRSYAVNLKHLDSVNSATVTVGGNELPLNKTYKQELLKTIEFFK